ncbi:strawberry notch-like NTP hydrolase domain-containing protein [Methylobacter luteus]|uniref:strawberry notch-like NTP hydrolase domain-containing protein n=1 Tax=Methylobacter luteus TaxID=415 RepID=UPI00041DF401|nr:strawberry notch family protein [Methylobacter luteus]
MAKQSYPDQWDLFDDWLVAGNAAVSPVIRPKETDSLTASFDQSRYVLALRLAEKLDRDGEITVKFLTDEANRAFGGTQAEGIYSTKDAYDAMEAAFNIHLGNTEKADWTDQDAAWANSKAIELTKRIQKLPTQTRRDEEMDEFQQFSTPPALAFVANWVANVKRSDVMGEPSAGTGDLAIWPKIAGAEIVLNELSPRRQVLLSSLFPQARLFKENAEQLDNVLPSDIKPSVIVMNPPFSSTAGRVQGQRDTSNGARHIEQALRRLQDGGRLVAVVGNGMAADRPAFSKWWKEIEKKYKVRANVGIAGKEYAKYGTTFDNQILVIDKTGPTTQPVLTGRVESVADLPALLEDIRNERQHSQREFNQPAVTADTQAVPDPLQPSDGARGLGSGAGGAGTESIGHGGDSGAPVTDSETRGESTIGDVVNDGIGAGSGVSNGAVGNTGGSSGADIGGNSGVSESNKAGTVTVEIKSGEVSEFTDSVFANYSPQRLTIPGAKPHPGKLVQSAAMSAVEPPAPIYTPVLPADLIQDGLLSIAQLESVVYAGQAHSQLLPNGSRKGFFIGDGTGVGKGREISGIILDNLMQGRNKAVWISFNEGLIEDARRDFAGVGGDPNKIFFQGKTKAGNDIIQADGILFTTYSTLRGGEKKQANDLGQKGGKTRTQQIIDWLGKDFDGVIAFDEAHSMGNAIAIKGKRGVKKPSQQAIAGINLQKELPNARVTYVSATGATEISNLSYADRLGLWGEGTPFADVNTFISDVSKGGIASMELISRDMKAMGMYLARSLSYDGVSYERLEHTLSDLQEDIYNELAGAWQIVLENVEEALEITQAGSSGPAKSAAMAQFWGAHQRFFNQIITAMQTPRVIDDIREQLAAGHVAVIQLVNTNEAAQERIIANATANDRALEDLDFTPRQMLMDYVRNGFPVAAYEESKDDNGNIIYVPVRDSEGNPVFDREAIALRDALLETLQQIRVPENPLDSIINAFGSDKVAEITGRSRRFVQVRDDEGNLKVVEEKRGKHSSRADAEAFQNNKKDILVFSGAGGTGYSFHADNTAENQRKRIHYILQPGWRADSAVQGFGRTHRTNQAQEPHYVLPTTNLKAQKRFVSSIARRLDQLGALTRGQREATSQGMFTASDNLESEYASIALKNFFGDLYRNNTDLSFHDVTKQMGLNLLDDNLSLNESKIPAIPQFLNRLLSLKTDMQNAVFGEFEKRLIESVEYAKQQGLYDVGLQTMTALSIKKVRDDVAYEDKNTGAQTRYVELDVTNEIQYNSWDDAKNLAGSRRNADDLSGWFVAEFGKNKGEVFFLSDIGERLDSEGHTVHRGVVHTIRKNDHRYIDNADVMSRGWDYRSVSGRYQKVTLTRAIDEAEAEKLWHEQVASAPKTETKTERMIVGAILPIWDRVEGSETIKRLQTDDGEQLLGRMLGPKAAKQTLKNLGLDSGLSNMTASDLFNAIKNGNKAILSNGWEITTAKVNHEDRIEIKGRSYLTDAEKRVLKEQGAFIERINWAERVFIPTNSGGIGVFERITASKPVVDLIEKNRRQAAEEAEQEHGIPDVSNEQTTQDASVEAITTKNVSDDIAVPSYQGDISMNQKNEKKPYHETVAENLIKQLEAGTAPWQRPWEAGASGSFLPYNPTTGNRYKGINALHLMSQNHDDQRWMTYKQAAAAGGQVRKGEKGTGIQYWKFTEEQIKKDDNGKPVLDTEGKPLKVVVRLERPRVFFATVFNGEQIDGLPPIQKKEQNWNPIERVENILAASGANIQHNGGERAFYRPSTDSIHLPDKGLFSSAERYYSTALHELGHWTGHSSRLDRDLAHPFGSEGYAKEELRAEIASMILGDELGIGHDPGQHAAYVGSWIRALKDDPLEIFRAAADAEKIQNYVLAFEQVQEQDQQQTTDPELVAEYFNQTQVQEISMEPSQHNAIESEQQTQRGDQDQQKSERQYINVPYREKGEAKALGARWDRQEQAWYIPPGVETAPFAKWAQGSNQIAMEEKPVEVQDQDQRTYLAVPYGERVAAKVAGAMWDKVAKFWYAGPDADMTKLERWKPDNMRNQQGPAMTPKEEFTEALQSLGCIVTGEHPIMDGKKHRIGVEGDKKGEEAGFYVGHLDGHPAGYIKNNRTGIDMKWKSKGYTLDPQEKAKLQAEAATKLAERAAEQDRLHEATAQRVSRQLETLIPVNKPTAYLEAKGIEAHAGALTDKEGQKTYIPAFDVEGKQWTMQYIQEGGTKRFAKDSRKEGCFHPVGGMDAVAAAPTLVIAEGYATAASLSEALDHATVAAFDSGNLSHVARALHEKFPDKPIIIAGDDDRHLAATQGINPGRVKAEEAAKAVGGKAIFPIFAPGEQAANPKAFTDFNDLATKSELGRDGVERQAIAAVKKALLEKDERQEHMQQLEQGQKQDVKQEQRPRRAMKMG